MNQEDHTSGSFRRSVGKNMVLLFITLSFTPMILVSAIILKQFEKSYHEKTYAHLEELVHKHRQNIDHFLREKLANLTYLAKMSSFEELSNANFIALSLKALQQNYGLVFEDMGVVNDRGQQVAYAGPLNLLHAQYGHAPWFTEAVQKPQYVSDVFMGLRQRRHFIVSVRNYQHGKPWILRATIDFASFNKLVEGIRIGETGFAFILNHKGEFQTKPLQDMTHSMDFYLNLFKKTRETQNKVHIFERADVSGRDCIYVATFLKDGEWLMVYQQLTSDAFRILRQTEKKAVLVLLAIGFCTLMIDIVFSVLMVRRVSKS